MAQEIVLAGNAAPGITPGAPGVVDWSTYAMRSSLRPDEWVAAGINGGHYAIGSQTGTMAAGIASAAQVFQVRWADPTKLFVLKKLVVQAATGTGFAATTIGCPLELYIGHSSTANGSGGTALAPNGVSQRMRSSMAPSAFVTSGEIRIATTSALGAATAQTLEPAAIGECLGAPNATLVQSPQMILWEQVEAGAHPLILAAGDTLVIQTLNPAATGTWFLSVHMKWLEVVTY